MTDTFLNFKDGMISMEKEKIIEILDAWNFWTKEPEVGITREDYLRLFEKLKETGQVVAIIGVRRSGKSTLIKQYIKRLIGSGEDRKNFLYINLEEPRFIDELSLKFLQDAYEAYLEIVGPTSKPYVFLDEVQNVKGWEKFVRALHEKNEAVIFISGSSAKLLSRELGTALTGRHVDIVVYPLTFGEFLAFNNLKFETRLELLSNKIKIKKLLREYLSHGGFPLVVLSKEKEEILGRYFDDILARDIAERHRIKKTDKLKILAKYYLTNISSQSSLRKIKNFIGISLDTVERFSYYLRDAYLIFFVSKFSYSLKEQEINPKKVYAVDLGLRNMLSFKFSDDWGKLYENAVFFELLKKNRELYYHRDRYECDFLVKKGETVKEAIQVCFALTEENKRREIDGLLEAMERFKLRNGTIITEDFEAKERHGSKIINFIPLWKWLLMSTA